MSTSKTVQVLAPSDLQAGYSFTAQVDGKDFQVTVPEGGVKEGQMLEVPYPDFAVGAVEPPLADAPQGAWRDSLFSCFDVFCNGMFWQAFCCTPLIIGQLLGRLRLDFCGSPGGNPSDVWKYVLIMLCIYLIGSCFAIGAFLYPFVFIWVLVTMTRIRGTLRRKYEIPAGTCGESMDDCCCAFWCTCCASIQMARHTHDYHKYPYQCCESTGLPVGAPEIV
mmetsp:Transcript_16319/g.23015  ORF Transcript_16319/g.23015 Transcript_16319/m.23015 type:complete len:221 (+) Transcript_16319:133-795(+)